MGAIVGKSEKAFEESVLKRGYTPQDEKKAIWCWRTMIEYNRNNSEAKRLMQNKVIALRKAHTKDRVSSLDYEKLMEMAGSDSGYGKIEEYIQTVDSACSERRKELVAQKNLSLEDHMALVQIEEDLKEIEMLDRLLVEWKILQEKLNKRSKKWLSKL